MIIFAGNKTHAWRDPACCYHEGVYHLFCTHSVKENGFMYNSVVHSQSRDLANWSAPVELTVHDHRKNFCSPGNMIRVGDEFVLCVTSYPMPVPFAECGCADETARLFLMRTRDFIRFSEPEILHPKGDIPFEEEGRMIDPFILPHNGRYLLFFKQNGVSCSESEDLVHWHFRGHIDGGENACVLPYDNRFMLIHSPKNGIGFKVSDDLIHWTDIGCTTLDQQDCAWANGRITAGFALKCPGERSRYALFYHGSRADSFPETHGAASLAVLETDMLPPSLPITLP